MRANLTSDIYLELVPPPDVPNNGCGWGIVDALAAFKKGKTITGSPHLPLLLLD